MSSSLERYYRHLSINESLPIDHTTYLKNLKKNGFEPKTIYDIGSCVLHWTKEAQKIWPDAEIILFDANPFCEFLYDGYKYYIGILSNVSNVDIKFYLNEFSPTGASYYREIGSPEAATLYQSNKYYSIKSITLDDVVEKYKFPLPDLIKMDIQGAEYDVIMGGTKTINHAKHLILELPKAGVQYNENAPDAKTTLSLVGNLGWKCIAPLFSDNGKYDGDYGFIKI